MIQINTSNNGKLFVMEAIQSRRTIFKFKPYPVPKNILEDILYAGIWAPNHHLTKPWRFIAILLVLLSFAVSYAPAQEHISWEAEDFTAAKGENFQIFEVPSEQMGAPRCVDLEDYTITEASGDTYIGVPNGPRNNSGDWVKYEFSVTEGDWYIWGRVIAPCSRDNSTYWAIDIDDADALSTNNAIMNIWDFYEAGIFQDKYTTDWVWFRLNSRDGPFEGTELIQHGNNPVPMKLSEGDHTLHLTHREDGTHIDMFFGTLDAKFDPNETDLPQDVELQGKLTTTWGVLKGER